MLLEQMLSHKQVGTLWDTVALCLPVKPQHPILGEGNRDECCYKEGESGRLVESMGFGEPGNLWCPGSVK